MARKKYGAKGRSIGQICKEARDREMDAAGVSVAVYGDDRGTKELHARKEIALDRDPTGATSRTVARVQDVLDIQLRRGNISQAEYDIGRSFQAFFRKAGFDRVQAVAWDGIPGGSGGSHYIEVSAHAHGQLRRMFSLIGGPESESAKAFFWVLGFEHSLNDLAGGNKKKSAYWSAALKSGLQTLAEHRRNEMF